MGKILMLIVVFLLAVVLYSLPLYLCVNLVCWLFDLTFRITLFQSFGLSLLAKVIHNLLFKKGAN